MNQHNIPFQTIDWSGIEKKEHRGERGTSWWQTVQFGGLRLRMVEYSPGYLADHWCRKGHIVHCIEGSFESELQDGRTLSLSAGGTYIVSDELSSHRSVSAAGVKLLIIDGDFLKRSGAGLLPDQLETERLRLNIINIDDAPFLRALVNTEGWLRFIGDRNVHSDADAAGYIQRMLGNADATVHVIRLKESATSVGITTLIKREYLDHPDIGFALLPQFEKRGFGLEASRSVLAALETAGKLEAVTAITIPENKASIRLLEKLGLSFRQEMEQQGERLFIFEKAIGAAH